MKICKKLHYFKAKYWSYTFQEYRYEHFKGVSKVYFQRLPYFFIITTAHGVLSSLSCVQLCASLWAAAHQALVQASSRKNTGVVAVKEPWSEGLFQGLFPTHGWSQ